MYQDISTALGDSFVMFYHPRWPSDQLRPVCTLDQCLQQINDRLRTSGKDLTSWHPGDQDQAARLLWVNWIYQNLQHEPIRKPILAHRENDDFVVDCGDTRLMALGLRDSAANVTLLITDTINNIGRYQGWTQIKTNQELLSATGFSPEAVILFNPGTHCAIDWLEIGDQSTSHHLHDVQQRIHMIQQYLDQQLDGFQFDKEWVRRPIDWASYDSIA